MGQTRQQRLLCCVFVAVSLSSMPFTSAYQLWNIDIDQSPAPPPELEPPFSAHAVRNRALLPYQILAIVASYFGVVLVLGTLLLTIGRRLRLRAQNMALRPVEMVKRSAKQFDESPISPASSRGGWYRGRLNSKKSANGSLRSGISAASPSGVSVVSFDTTVIEADRMQRQEEMERLYAAVMAQDDTRVPPGHGDATSHDQDVAPPEYSRGIPPRTTSNPGSHYPHPAPPLRQLQIPEQPAYPHVPLSPRSPVRAIYPPEAQMPAFLPTPSSPLRAEYPQSYFPPSSSQPDSRGPSTHERALSIGSQKSTTSGTSGYSGKKSRRSIRSLKISAPLPTEIQDGARTPATPRIYIDPGLPPEPPTARTMDSQAPLNPSRGQEDYYRNDRDEDLDEDLDEIADLPQAHPSYFPLSALPTPKTDQRGRRLPPSINTSTLPPSPAPQSGERATPKATTAASINNPLPFRQMAAQQRTQTLPLQPGSATNAAFPLSPTGGWRNNSNFSYPTSAGPTKTTFLETKRTHLGVGTPLRTGMATPYSPYMPFTPLTPVMTPRLPTRAERKQREKEKRKLHGVLTEEDEVQNEDDLWGSGY